MVASCREKTTRSPSLIPLNGARMSFWATLCSFTSMTRSPCWRSSAATAIVARAFHLVLDDLALLVEGPVGVERHPLPPPVRHAPRDWPAGSSLERAAGEAEELVGVAGTLLGLRAGDESSPHEGYERRVHGLHPELAAGLHGGVDLMVLPLPDEVPHAGRRHQHLAGHDPPLAVVAWG